jgi:hypothetical protein
LGTISAAFAILSFHCAHDSAHGLRGDRAEPWDINLPTDTARWEVRHASSEGTWTRGEGERDRCSARRAVKRQGAILSPLSPLRATASPHRDVVPRQSGSTAGECRLKHRWGEGGLPTSLYRQLLPT